MKLRYNCGKSCLCFIIYVPSFWIAPAEWKMPLLSFRSAPSAQIFRAPLALRSLLMERCALYAILAGRFFTCVGGEGGRRPFKWSTWRLWPVINEFAVSHGSCKETSGSEGEGRRGKRAGDTETWLGDGLSMRGWKMAAPNMLSLIQNIIIVILLDDVSRLVWKKGTEDERLCGR